MNTQQTPLGWQWVAVQFILMTGIGVAPTVISGAVPSPIISVVGIAFLVIGFGITVMSIFNLGESLSAFPRPKADGQLIQTGLYALVRHPIYFGILLGALGWSLMHWSWLALAGTLLLALLFDRKAAIEETWLTQKFPAYTEYKQRVRKLFPGVY
jgi:protein-S-isoprenylcysteine O-methyltransferase Ste14